MTVLAALSTGLASAAVWGQATVGAPPPTHDPRVAELAATVSAQRLEQDVRALAGFGTRHSLSDTLSPIRGIGAARRWIHAEFERMADACGGCLEVSYQRVLADSGARVPRPTWIVNVVARLPGLTDPARVVMMTAHYDSRASDVQNDSIDAPGANDDGSGTAAVLEAARVLSAGGRRFGGTIGFAALAGEEQGLLGGRSLAAFADSAGWRVEAVLNNDIVGNTTGQSGLRDTAAVRVFSESPAAGTSPEALARLRVYGGEVDSPSRQLARYVKAIATRYLPHLDARLIYRLDRFGRGGDHRAFNDRGMTAVRLTEPHEDYRRQHQDIRVEEGIAYGDVPDAVDFAYAARVAALNAVALATLAWAPAPPDSVMISGAVEPSARLRWAVSPATDVAGYRIYWRETTSPTWDHHVWAGRAGEREMTGLAVDNWFFGVAAVSAEGNESLIVFPTPARP